MKRYPDMGILVHDAEIGFLTSLLLDLKKRELGRPHEPITHARLDEASRHVRELFKCRKQGLFK